MKKNMSLLLIVMLVIGLVPAMAVANEVSATNQDPLWDVEKGKWYYKDIHEVYARGMITGKEQYGQLSFKPEDKVSQTEALAMVLRYLDLETAAKALTDEQIDLRLNQIGVDISKVQNWERPYVAYSILRGYIKTKADAVGSPATRLWIAQLLVQALEKEGEARSTANATPTKFTDDRTIPADKRGFVNVVVSLGLMQGALDEGVLNFNPNGVTSRAEMATMLLRLDKHALPASTVKKEVVIKELHESSIEYQSEDGYMTTMPMNNPTVFKATGPNRRDKVSLRDVKPFDNATIIIRNGAIVYIDLDGTKGIIKENVIYGKFDKIESTSIYNLLTLVTNSGDKMTLSYEEPLIVKDEQGNTLILADLKKDDELRITVADNRRDIKEIVVLGVGKGNPSDDATRPKDGVSGTFITLDEATKSMTIELSDGSFKNYRYTMDTKLIYQQQRFPTVADLKTGDRVRILTEDTIIVEIEVLGLDTINNAKESGIIDSLNDKGTSITIKKGDQVTAFPVSAQVSIEISGMYQPTWVDLKVGHLVNLTLDQGKVTKIAVTGDSTTQVLKGRFIDANVGAGILNYLDANGKPAAQFMAENVYVEMEGIPWRITDLQKDMRISITLKDSQVTQIILDNKRQGIIKSIDAANRKLVVTHGSTDVNYVTQWALWIDALDKPNATLKDLAIGQEIQFYLNPADEIKNITVSQILEYTVISVDTKVKSLQVLRNLSTSWIPYNNSIQLVIPGSTNPLWEQLKGMQIKVTYFGKTITKIEKK